MKTLSWMAGMRATGTAPFGPWRPFASSCRRAAREHCGGVPCSVHVPRAGSPKVRFESSPPGPPPLLHSPRHPTAVLWAAPWQSKAQARTSGSPRRMPGDRRSEVKEEGRIGWSRSEQSVNRPGGHERSRSPGSLRARRPTHVAKPSRTTAMGRMQSLQLPPEGAVSAFGTAGRH